MTNTNTMLLSGNEAIAHAAFAGGIGLGVGYPGTPSTEILENFSLLGGRAQWSPNEKVALEVGIGHAFAGGRTLVTMKHVGLNVAADPLFTVAYTGTTGGLVIISADDPGMASSQNEQDNRHYAEAAGVVMIEPSDSQEAHDYLLGALEISERWGLPVMLRLTTRVCHSKTIVRLRKPVTRPEIAPYEKDPMTRVMIPAYARPAHRRLRQKLADIAKWNEGSGFVRREDGDGKLGIIVSGITYVHAREAAPEASFLKLGLTHPLPMAAITDFVASVERCVVLEEGDPWLVNHLKAQGLNIEGKGAEDRFGELNVARVRNILFGTPLPAAPEAKGKPPQLCNACPHRSSFGVMKKLGCIVAGDIGCYTLSVLPPFETMDTCVCMGASIGVGLGMRHSLPEDQARRVVSVIGDSTFVHSGITGLVEMVYNTPPTGHVVIILDNGTTAMTGLQEHAGTGRKLDHAPTHKIIFEDLARSIGIKNVFTLDPVSQMDEFESTLSECLASNEPSLIIARRNCLLAAGKIRQYEQAAEVALQESCERGCENE